MLSTAIRDNTPSKFPVMTFDKKVHDFGTIMDGEAQETVFSYTNTGEAPLVITETKSTCRCTVFRLESTITSWRIFSIYS